MAADAVAKALVEQVREENQALRALVAEFEKRIADLVAENKALRDQLDDAHRQAARQAAPFRRRDSKKVPDEKRKRPGRPKGHPGAHRVVPTRVGFRGHHTYSSQPTGSGYGFRGHHKYLSQPASMGFPEVAAAGLTFDAQV